MLLVFVMVFPVDFTASSEMSSQEFSSSGNNDSKLSLSLSQETMDYMWRSVEDIANTDVWSVARWWLSFGKNANTFRKTHC